MGGLAFSSIASASAETRAISRRERRSDVDGSRARARVAHAAAIRSVARFQDVGGPRRRRERTDAPARRIAIKDRSWRALAWTGRNDRRLRRRRGIRRSSRIRLA
jgi:hypothetical protein